MLDEAHSGPVPKTSYLVIIWLYLGGVMIMHPSLLEKCLLQVSLTDLITSVFTFHPQCAFKW